MSAQEANGHGSPQSHGAPQDHGSPHEQPDTRTIPAVSWPDARQAASERRGAYPYRFPRDSRQLGGKYSVEENARRLLRYFYFERRLAQALGAWTLAIPEFEVKLEGGRHLFFHADAARTLRERLHEQEKTLAQIDGFRDAEIDAFIDELLSATDAPELLVGIHQVAGAGAGHDLSPSCRRHRRGD